ncbi:hypothetical protein LHK_00073 [Laribacter hongkongensis HLHK9]|uniref:Uncharacterized protein n=1 Tax=Laribacter hongkongensis (strain HLHK9) TaxID=557598 RepID=C1D9V6_LARHH|nr:hypothetical protein [Laribacter hongkongensis]ACO73069.1 hypothetical protein LHK_00073 [Laribacter hongkongensis HLHK9]
MKFTTLIQAAELAALPAGDVVIADCRHQLTDPGYGRAAWAGRPCSRCAVPASGP